MENIYIIYVITFVFLLLAVYVYNGYKYELRKQFHSFHKSSLKLSVIIAAKNEANNINSLVDALEKLDYPEENHEIIFIDDNSTDNTFSVLESRIADKKNCFLLSAIGKKFEGKKGALAIGIENARHNMIVITDADCRPAAEWLKAIAGKLDAGFDFVFGVAPIRSGPNTAQKLSAFENLRNTFLTLSAVGLNIPYSAAARSLAFRKKSYERVGGYAKTTDTISGDDDLLLREAVRHRMLIGTLIDSGAFVYSSSPENFKEYLRQKQRHLKTSFKYLLKQKLFLLSWHTINLLCVFPVFLVLLSPALIIPFTIKIAYDIFIVLRHQNELGHSFRLYEIIYLQILFEFFIVLNFFNSITGKPLWK